MNEFASTGSDERDEQQQRPAPARTEAPRPTGSGMRFYKPGQGYYVRLFTAVGVGILSIWGSFFLLDELSDLLTQGTTYYYPRAVRRGRWIPFGDGCGCLLGGGAQSQGQ